MPLTTVAAIKATGGLDHADDYNLGRYTQVAELDAALTACLNRAVAYLRSRAAATVYSASPTGSAVNDELFRGAEELLALHFFALRLKSRKVFGTHWAVDTEGSERYEELIDQEYLKQAELLIEPFVTIDEGTPAVFALPAFTSTQAIDPADIDSIETQIEADLNEALGFTPSLAVLP